MKNTSKTNTSTVTNGRGSVNDTTTRLGWPSTVQPRAKGNVLNKQKNKIKTEYHTHILDDRKKTTTAV